MPATTDASAWIHNLLAAAAEEIRGHLFDELLGIELERKMQHGRSAPLAEYLTRFPDRTYDIQRVFEEVSQGRGADDFSMTTGRSKPDRDLALVSVPGYEVEETIGRAGMPGGSFGFSLRSAPPPTSNPAGLAGSIRMPV